MMTQPCMLVCFLSMLTGQVPAMFNHDMEQCIIDDVVNKNHGSTIPSGQNTLETCACKIYFVDLPLSKSKHPSCTIAMAMKKPAGANTPSTKRIAEPAAELKSDEESLKLDDEQKDDEDQEKTKEEGKDQEIEGSKAKQVKPIQTKEQKQKQKQKELQSQRPKEKPKQNLPAAKFQEKKQDSKKDKVKKLVKKKKKQGQEKEEAGLLITSVLYLFAATCF